MTSCEFTTIELHLIEVILLQLKIDYIINQQSIKDTKRDLNLSINDYTFIWSTDIKKDVIASYISKKFYCRIYNLNDSRADRLLDIIYDIIITLDYFKQLDRSMISSFIKHYCFWKKNDQININIQSLISRIRDAYKYYCYHVKQSTQLSTKAFCNGVNIYTPNIWKIASDLYVLGKN